jgi:transposase-like protein
MDQPPDVKLALLQHHAEMARLLAEDVLEGEVEDLTGERYERKSSGNSLRRWGTNSGSIRIDGERVPIEVPRVRDVEAGEERPLQSYQAMKESTVGKELTDAILLGLSQGDYERVASQFIDGFGLSQSSVSRRFQERAQKTLEEFEERSLEAENFLALWIDGKRVAGEQMIVCLGVTEKGYKKVLGFTQATTERSEPIVELLRDLLERGLTFEEGILCVIDGSKGLRKAIREVFGQRAEVQRCQWHKRENVVSYLPKADQKKWRKKLQRAYQEPTYEAAKERLTDLHAELQQINRTAAHSLQEGLEETLTLHRLGLFEDGNLRLPRTKPQDHKLHRKPHGGDSRPHRQRETLAPLPAAPPVDGPGADGVGIELPSIVRLPKSARPRRCPERRDTQPGMTLRGRTPSRCFN